MGEQRSDSVFTRSFSALVIALILNYDRKRQILSDQFEWEQSQSNIVILLRKLHKDLYH
ncbi:DUF2785 domain-containing protein [Alkalibacillus haloalkaliphilus]|uniref:DUF2785 domain-containing protein n=1 Tax=Alkalibacillus haloalkaliphilus TaxID=94136 RepID=UPI003C2DDB6F